ncbi:MAG: T9SS type A sorting domain-containing protein [Bacteroidota bacterium]
MNHSRTFRLRFWLTLCMLTMLWGAVSAQPDLNFKRLRLQWPYVEVYFSVGCNGIKNYFLQPSDVRLFEDGREITDFGLWCPDPTSRCPITVGLVFDASDSMAGEGNLGAKAGGAAFIRNMDDIVDEACVVHFNQSVWVYQNMTTDTSMLQSSVSLLPASGATALWDAIFTSLAIVQNNGHNQCRAIIVLSDGDDNSSTRHGLPDVISFAVRYNIRVFPIGYGENIAEDDLKMLAELTGGEYYQTPNASELAGIYKEISTILYDYFQECMLNFDPRCGDYLPHDVELRVEDLCGGSASMIRTYIAPQDSSTLRVKEFDIEDATGMGGAEIRMAIELRTPFFKELFYPASIDLTFDHSKVQLKRVETPSGTLLAGMNVQIADQSSGGIIRIPEGRVLESTGTLCYAVFKTTLHSSSADYTIRVKSAVFDKGCIIPQIAEGVLHVTPSKPLLQCGVQVPNEATWNAARNRYEPYPLFVRFDVNNIGTLPAVGGKVYLEYDPSVFELMDPQNPFQNVDTLRALGQSSLQWKLSIKPQTNTRVSELCLRTEFDGVDEERCCASVSVPVAGMLLTCDLTVPKLQYDSGVKAFVPNPFDISMVVDNPGVVASGELRAVLQLPEGLYVENGEPYDKVLNPSFLAPGESTTVKWKLRLISPLGGDVSPIRIELRNDGATYSSCTDTLNTDWVPAVFQGTATALGSTTFCEGDSVQLDAGEGYMAYRWNNGLKTRIITVHSSGTYFAVIRNVQGDVGQTTSIQVYMRPRPPKPIITREFNTLIVDTQNGVQWYRNGSPVSGATDPRNPLLQTGTYVVVVIDGNGCTNQSDPFLVNILPVEEALDPSVFSFTLYPHPVGAVLRVRMQGAADGREILLRIVNLLGQTISERIVRAASATQEISIDVSGLHPGVYVITAIGQEQFQTAKFLKQ